MAQSNELRVFISSTFRDLQEEREHLVKKIFPEIRALCRQRGITFTEVDLRWGLTKEQSMLGTVIRTCLEEIDKCRPYFIGMIGNRYGWAPELHEILMDPELLSKYPWIEEVAMEGTSVTEMEFIHGVFDAPQVDGEYAFFYHRQSDISDADDPEHLAALIARTRATRHPFREFSSIDELGKQVHDDMMGMIDRYWPQSEVPSALELERRSHVAFAASRTRAYIPNPELLKAFSGWLSNGTLPLVIVGVSGLGKSSLVAYLVEYYRKKHPTALVIEHYVGASHSSGTALAVMRHVIEEIRERFAIDEELPSKPEELEKGFANWLFRAGHHATQAGIAVLIVVDAVNQLDETGQRLEWLPKTIPSGVKLLISTTPGDGGNRLGERGWESLEVRPLEDERVRQSIVVRYLGEFHKGIAPEQLRQVVGDAKASSPLYLRVVAEELRLHGEHETLPEVIEHYVTAENLDEVFQQVLERMERDYGAGSVHEVLSLVWCSRSGLSETEVLELTGVSRMELSRLLFALDYHLLHRDGLLGFFHDYLRRAVEKRYLKDEVKRHTSQLQIAEYFHSRVISSIAASGQVPLHMASELCYQLQSYGAIERLRECLSNIPVFLALYTGATEYEVLGYWSSIGGGSDVVGSYRRGMAEWSMDDARERSRGMGRVTHLLERLGEWAGAIELARERLALALEHGYKSEEAISRRRIGWLLILRGEHNESLDELTQALALFTELGDGIGISLTIGNMGGVYFDRREYDRAIECFERQLSIAEEAGDRSGVSYAIGNMGSVYASRGEYEQAIECYERALRIDEELGDRSGVSRAIGNMGIVFDRRGEPDRALECYERALRIDEELGDRVGISRVISNIGIVYQGRGEYDRAIECYERHLRICEELGDRGGIALANGNTGMMFSVRGEHDRALECYEHQLQIVKELGDRHELARTIGNMATVYISRGEHDRALEGFHRAVEEHRAIGFSYGLTHWLEGIGQALVELVQADVMPEYLPDYIPGATVGTWHADSLRYARACVEECIAISDDISKPDTQFSGRVLLARTEAADGHKDEALHRIYGMLKDADNDAQQADLHYWLWKLGEPGHAVQSLTLYESLYAATPNHDYHTRIDELKTAGERA